MLYMGAALLLMVGCSEDSLYDEGGRTPINLSNTVVQAIETRAATNLNDGCLSLGDMIMVKISKTSESVYSDYAYAAKDNAGNMIPANTTIPTYPDDGSNVKIRAFYPSTAVSTFTVMTNQTADADYKASDLMFASISNQSRTTETVGLAFVHQMAKIIVNASGAEGSGITITGVTLKNILPTITFTPDAADIADVVSAASGDPVDITMTNEGAALIPAQDINGTFLVISTSAGDATYSLSKTFAMGHQYTLNIIISTAAIGTTNTIIGWDGDGTVNVDAYHTYAPGNARAVDLGLSVKWANMNVGATEVTDYGTYFAWGETYGYTVVGHSDTPAAGNVKTVFDWSCYAWCKNTTDDPSNNALLLCKYCPTSKQSTDWFDKSASPVIPADNLIELQLCDDAARVNWGGKWRFPTRTEFEELLNDSNCDWVWYSDYNDTGCPGYLVTSKKTGFEGNSIFLPAAGVRNTRVNGNYYGQNTYGFYWTSTLDPDYPSRSDGTILESSRHVIGHNNDHRSVGRTVRAVWEP